MCNSLNLEKEFVMANNNKFFDKFVSKTKIYLVIIAISSLRSDIIVLEPSVAVIL